MEYEKCKKDAALLQEFLKKKMISCFENMADQNVTLNFSNVFIQYCIYPRLIFSSSDALYSFNFLKML